MHRQWDRRVRLLVVAAVGEAAIALALSVDVLTGGGDRADRWGVVLSIVGLAWLTVFGAVVSDAARHVGRLNSEVSRGTRAVADHAVVSHEWLWECSPELIWTYCGPRVTEFLGYRPEALAGHSTLELLPADGAHRMREMVAGALKDRCGWRDVELEWRHADGYLVAMQDSASPIVDERGRVVGFRGTRRPVPDPDQAPGRSDAREQVRRLIASRGLGMALQPIVSAVTGRLVGVEALARFDDDRPAEEWFRLARLAQMTVELEQLTVEVALEALGYLPDHAYLSVNASPDLVLDPCFRHTLGRAGGGLDRLVLEVTEHVEIRTYEEIAQALHPLRQQGLRVAVDDAGAGYASFHHVLRLRPDIIKIDRSLINNVTTDPARRVLITAVVLVAFELQAAVTAEGVESPSELETIASLGVDAIQGHLLARPTTDPALWALWSDRNWLEPLHTGS